MIRFEKNTHTYRLWDRKFPISWTWRVNQFYNKFEADKFAQREADKRNKEWALKPNEQNTTEADIQEQRTKEDILAERKEKGRISTDEIWTPFHEIMEHLQILLYKLNNLNEAEGPNVFKGELENHLNNYQTNNNDLKKIIKRVPGFFETFFSQTINTLSNKQTPKYKPIAQELIVGNKRLLVVWTIDAILYNTETNSYEIRDWKTSKEISSNWYWKLMKQVFNKYPDSNYFHYSLQLSLYKYLLQQEDTVITTQDLWSIDDNLKLSNITDLYLWNFSYKKNNYEVIKAVDMTKEIHKYFVENKDLF